MKLNKGFTLIELLIVMVIVGLLVTIALPQYKVAMEKGRALEALHNVQAMSDAVNAEYIKNMMTSAGYPASIPSYAGVTLNKSFVIDYSANSTTATISAQRQGLSSGNTYTIIFTNTNGAVSERFCTGNQKYCNAIGAVEARSGGGWRFFILSEGSI